MEINASFNPVSAKRARSLLGITSLIEVVTPIQLKSLGFVGDGASHPLSGYFTTLADAQRVWPYAVSLQDEIDETVLRHLLYSRPGQHVSIEFPANCIALTSRGLESTYTASITYRGTYSTVRAVRAAENALVHGYQGVPAQGPFTLTGVNLEYAGPAAHGCAPIRIFYNQPGIGRGQAVTIRDSRIDNFPSAVSFTNVPRGLDMSNVVVFGKDFALTPGAGIEFNATADFTGGCFSYTFHNVMVANYETGFKSTVASALEGIVFESCRVYNGWSFAQVNCTKAGYRSLLWTFNDCDYEGRGFALILQNVEQVLVRGGFWIMGPNIAGWSRPIATPNNEDRMFDFRNVGQFDIAEVYMVAHGPGGEATRDNFVFVNADTQCENGVLKDNIVKADRAYPTCCFRLAGRTTNTIRETGTRITYLWGGGAPVVLYGGDGGQTSLQTSGWDAARSGGSVSPEGVYTLSGVFVGSTDANGRIRVNLPKRSDLIAGGVLALFTEAPKLTLTADHGAGAAASFTIVQRAPDFFIVQVQSVGSGFIMGLNWLAVGK